MDINNNQQTNTFTGGMNTDTSDALLKPQEYRKAVNLRPVTNTDSNDGELHLIDGVEHSFIYAYFSEIYATTSIREIGIVVGKKQGDTGWGIYKFQNNPSQTITCIFGPCTEELGSQLSLVTRWESDTNVKLYIADGEHKLMSINIMHTDYTGTTPPSSIEYIADTDNNVPQILVGTSSQSGNIKGVVVQYAYVLYKQYGSQSNISPLTRPISLYNGDRGFKQNEYTDKSISLTLEYSSNFFNKIRIYRIAYVQNGQEPEINIIVDQNYSGRIDYLDTGYNISEVSYSEFIGQFGIDVKPVLIESKENTLFAANVEYDQKEVDDLFQNVSVTYTPYCDSENRDYHVSPQGVYTDMYNGYGPSLMPGETYRYGIIFYDMDGRRTSVMHIEDVNIPTYFDTLQMCSETVGDQVKGYYISKIGITAQVDFPNEDVRNKCSGYEIVRCERTIKDSKIITQGIVGCTNYETSSSAITDSTYPYNERFASPFMSLWKTYFTYGQNGKFYKSAGDLLMFASPEYIYLEDEYKNIIKKYSNKLQLDLKYTYFINFETKSSYSGGDVLQYQYIGEYEDENTKRIPLWNTSNSAQMRITGQNTSSYTESSSIKDDDFYIRNSYIYPTSYTNTSSFGVDSTRNIKYIEYVSSPEYNKFDNGSSIIIDDDSTIIGNLKYVNWSTNNLYKDGEFNDTNYSTSDYKLFVASGKKCILIYLQDKIEPRNTSTYAQESGSGASNIPVPITISNIINNSVTPYGGSSDEAKNNSIFYSFGNYYIPSQLSLQNTRRVYDGDEYLGLFIYNSCHTYNSAVYKSSTQSIVYAVPVYSRVDLKGTYGDLYPYISNSKKYYLQDAPVSFNGYNQEHSAYLYNPAYNQTPIADKLVAIDWTTQPSEKYDTRVIYSNEKTNNEQIDSWLMFKSANYMDVDTRYGEITNLRLFKNTLVFWQEYATGMLSVNERTMIQDANATNIILGNGDVLQRYDYLTTTYGSAKNKRCETQSDTTLYWWDYIKGEILGYSGGQSVQPLSKVKNISNYVRSNDKQLEPAVTYDQDNKEVLFNVVKDGTVDRCLVYNEVVQSFTSLYDLPFKYSIDISDKKYYIQNNKIFLQTKNAQNAVSTNNTNLTPCLKYIVNNNPQYNKVYDIQTIGGTLYDGDNLTNISMQYTTPLKQIGKCDGTVITNREYDFRLNVPRAGKLVSDIWTVNEYGDRLRGKTMQCELWSSSNSTDFSLQYITTKYRMSWS